ncbi:MAG: hypothetical protein WCX79_03975 [Candidatus Paceibacterota bacterium]|jgi:hypothetical protein
MNKTVFWSLITAIFIFLFVTVKTDSLENTTKRVRSVTGLFSKTDSNEEDKNDGIEWAFNVLSKLEGENNYNIEVVLKNEGKEYKTGVYAGNCFVREGNLFPGEIAPYVVCHQNGSGVELGVFKENENLFLKKGILELGADEEYPSYRGGFTNLFEVK